MEQGLVIRRTHGLWYGLSVTVGIGLIAVGLIVTWPRKGPGSSSAVSSTVAIQGALQATVAVVGWWRAAPTVALTAPQSGVVQWMPGIGLGSIVKRGQSLVRVNPPGLSAELQQAYLTWQAAIAQSAAAQAQVQIARHAASSDPSSDPTVVAAQQTAQEAADQADADYAAWQALKAESAPLTSPERALVTTATPSGTYVSAGESLGQLQPLQPPSLAWQGFVPAGQVSSIHPGDSLLKDGRAIGVVRVVVASPVTYQGTQGYWVYATRLNHTFPTLWGVAQTFAVVTRQWRHAVIIPNTAYRLLHGQGGVYVWYHGRWQFRRVDVLGTSAWRMAVSGLTPGTRIAIGGVGHAS